MVENIPNNQPLIILAVALISSVTTIVVTLISKRVEKHVATRPPKNAAGYERLIKYIEHQLTAKEAEIRDLRELLNTANTRNLDLEGQNRRMRSRLLEVSREYGVDVSNVIQ